MTLRSGLWRSFATQPKLRFGTPMRSQNFVLALLRCPLSPFSTKKLDETVSFMQKIPIQVEHDNHLRLECRGEFPDE